ncbi:hypothetical protein IE53DRAFT_360377 [Violaceomyces palustris]|uniref:Uncharacterized protein n=1 Tax=Violaceomyces palustris TaxID=1673888 RepID=A0ACD0P497_9BASI|nr:hypothetical protein IE53DRAFT_360377 [Violaceomyces palustris]
MSSSHSTPQKRHAASTPSKLSRSTSNTPYHLFSDSPSTSSSPFARRTHASSSSSSSSTSALLTPSKTHIFNASLSTNASPVFRRNVGFGSPGFRASAAPASARRLPAQRGAEPRLTSPHTKGHAGRPIRESSRFVRRKPWLERIQSAPVDLYFAIQSHLSDLEDLFHQPSLGYPIGVSLHLISFLTHLISPDSSLGKNLFGTRRPSSPLSKASRINKGGLPGLGFEKAERLKRLAQSQTTVWLRYVSLLLAILLVLLSCWNAYLLFTSRRQYRLWMRREDEKVASENARLVPALIPDEDRDSPKTTWVEKGVDLALKALSHVPIVGWFVPLPPTKPPNPHQSRMHALNIWQAPEVPLRIFRWVPMGGGSIERTRKR